MLLYLLKYENLVSKHNIQVLNHVALVSHVFNNPEFTFLERENKMLISHYIEDLFHHLLQKMWKIMTL